MENTIFRLLLLAVLWPFALAAALARTSEAAPSPRVALVIGNNRYEPAVGPLRNTVNDAKAMAKTLQSLGFVVIEKHNVTRDELLTALLQFHARLKGAQVSVFYFAGHGLSVAGSNYLVPIKSGYAPDGASAATDADRRLLAETKLFNAEQAVADMHSSGVSCNLVILDACRTTPIARDPRMRDGAAPGGLVEMNPPAGSLVAFATDAGRAAADGEGANGLYTEELVKHLLTPGLTIEQVFKRTRAAVMERSGGAQIPAEYSRLVGDDIYLAGAAPAKPVEEPIPRAQPVPLPTLAGINKIAASGDAVSCLEALQSYLRGQTLHNEAAAPLGVLLDHVKESLRNPAVAATNAQAALDTCELILPAIPESLPEGATRNALLAKAQNRKGDALLLLGKAEDALTAYNTAVGLDPNDGYILYNRGRAYVALDRSEEARADFTAAAGPRFKRSGVHKLAREALDGLK